MLQMIAFVRLFFFFIVFQWRKFSKEKSDFSDLAGGWAVKAKNNYFTLCNP